ncbi:MAG: nucleoside triphosphate pyrophosphohydrolase [Bauldia litoralis]
MTDPTAVTGMPRLLAIMARLRDPDRGCPWDVEQDFATIAPYTIEEAYEVADAIERADMDDLKDELGDLLFQVVFHSRMAEEGGAFAFDDVVEAVCDKMVRRHPHVFGEAAVDSAAAQTVAWEEQKARERGQRDGQAGALDGVPLSLPALLRAAKLGKRAARVGFDWPDIQGILNKVAEEIDELKAEISAGDRSRAEAELGDVLFSLAQLARRLEVDPETALRGTNGKVERRFGKVEDALRRDGRSPADASIDELETLWLDAKKFD